MLLIGSYGEGIFRSDDNGQTWRAFNEGVRNSLIDDLNVYRNVVIAATDDGLYRLNVEGTAWEELKNFAATVTGGANGLARLGNALYATTFGRGIWVSVNNGESWYQVNQGMTIDRSFTFAIVEGNLFVGSAGNGVFVLHNPAR